MRKLKRFEEATFELYWVFAVPKRNHSFLQFRRRGQINVGLHVLFDLLASQILRDEARKYNSDHENKRATRCVPQGSINSGLGLKAYPVLSGFRVNFQDILLVQSLTVLVVAG